MLGALTVSSHLTQLCLIAEDQQPLPVGARQHMFLAGSRFPQLRYNCITVLVEQDDTLEEVQEEWCIDKRSGAWTVQTLTTSSAAAQGCGT